MSQTFAPRLLHVAKFSFQSGDMTGMSYSSSSSSSFSGGGGSSFSSSFSGGGGGAEYSQLHQQQFQREVRIIRSELKSKAEICTICRRDIAVKLPCQFSAKCVWYVFRPQKFHRDAFLFTFFFISHSLVIEEMLNLTPFLPGHPLVFLEKREPKKNN